MGLFPKTIFLTNKILNNPLTEIKLTIQDAGKGKFRFGVSVPDSKLHFLIRGRNVKINLSKDCVVFTKTLCGVKSFLEPDEDYLLKRKKGYDIYSTCIDAWIKNNLLDKKINGKRKVAIFKLTKSKDWLVLTFLSIANRL